MANRPVLRRRGVTAAPAPEPVKAKKAAKPVVEEEEIDEEELEEVEDAEEEEPEEEEEEPAPVIRKKAPAPAPVAKKAVAAPPPAKVAAKKAAPVVADDDEPEEPVAKVVKVKPVDATLAGASMLSLLENMADGSSILITRTADNKWLIANTDGKTEKKGLTGRAYWDEVIDPGYIAWDKEWSQLTQDERLKKAKKAGVTWVEDKDPRINIMRASEAYREQIGIEKYKPQYRTRADRAKIKG